MDLRHAVQQGTSKLLHASSSLLLKSVDRLQPLKKTPSLLIWPVWQSLPVAGLDALSGQSVLYTLRSCLAEVKGCSSKQQRPCLNHNCLMALTTCILRA